MAYQAIAKNGENYGYSDDRTYGRVFVYNRWYISFRLEYN